MTLGCRSLSIVETLGSVNVLCSVRTRLQPPAILVTHLHAIQDKTGTLTQNIMHVQNVAIAGPAYDVEEYNKLLASKNTRVSDNIIQCAAVAAICNAAIYEETTVDNPKPSSLGSQVRSIIGNATGR